MIERKHTLENEGIFSQDSVLEKVFNLWKQEGGKRYVPISGISMLPLLREGDQVLIEHHSINIKKGDIIVYWTKGKLIAHRILRIEQKNNETVFITKGDNLPLPDPPVNAHAVLGKVLAIKRGKLQISIDTDLWKILGRFIVFSSSVRIKLRYRCKGAIVKVINPRFINDISFFHRRVRSMFFYMRKIILFVFLGWK